MDNAAIKDNFSALSEFFSVLAKEKSENRKRLENTIAVLENDKAPEDAPINISEDTSEPQIIHSDLANLFKNLENALLETKEESVVSIDEQIRLDEFSKLVTSFNSSTPSPIKKVEIIDTVDTASDTVSEEDKLESFSKEEPEEVESIIGYEDEPEEELIEAPNASATGNLSVTTGDDYIKNTVTQITAQADVYEKPITDFESLQKEFITFKHKVIEQLSIATRGVSSGGGATKINDMDDLDTTGREDGDSLIYNSSTNKYTFSSASTPPDLSNQLSLEDSIDGNLLMNGTDSSSTDAGDDFLQESGVNSGRDLDQNVLQELTSNIIPQAGGTYELGSENKRFKKLWLASETVDLGGATISSDGSGIISISADGVTLPTGSKDADGFVLARTTAETNQTFKIVKLFTQASGLTTAATSFKFNAELANRAVYTEAGHVFTLSNGDARSDAGADIFQF
jgi:hypothetical protein